MTINIYHSGFTGKDTVSLSSVICISFFPILQHKTKKEYWITMVMVVSILF